MSIHQLAHHLQSAGRGEDKVLVHMTPQEVNGLQALAMAHGGSLTINPKTGLPEAGFLSAILPMVAGFFLGPAGLGIAQSALGAAAMVGGATGIATGSLTKGLMAGLGAYGGFGLAESLAGAGAAANATKAGVSAIDDVAAGIKGSGQTMTGADVVAKQQALSATPETLSPLQAKGGLDAFKGYPQSAGDYIKSHSFTPAVSSTNQAILNSPTFVPPAPAVPAVPAVPTNPTFAQIQGTNINAMPELAGKIANPIEGAAGKTIYPEAVRNVGANGQVNTNWENVKSGFSDVTSSGDKAWNFIKKNPTPFIGAGLGLLSEFSGSGKGASAGGTKQPGTIRPYEYSVAQNQSAYAPSDSTAERTYFTEPRFIAGTPYTAKEGGLMGYAVGGPVEEMSAQNAIGSNTGYPMANIQTPMYVNPQMSRPMPTNVISPSADAGVDTYTGEQRFANGGVARFGGGGAMQFTPEGQAKQDYLKSKGMAGQNGPRGIMRTIDDDEWARIKKENNISIPSAASAAPTYTYNPATMQYTDNAGKVTGGMQSQNQAQPQPQPQLQLMPPIAANVNMPVSQAPEQQLGLDGFYNMMGDQLAMKGAQLQAQGQGYAVGGGISDLGGYSDGGRLLRGPGDGVSDSIPASIGSRQPARLADGEFVVPARIVSEIGNGSTEAGARKLYAMMDRVQKARKKTVGKNQVAKNTKAEKLLPA